MRFISLSRQPGDFIFSFQPKADHIITPRTTYQNRGIYERVQTVSPSVYLSIHPCALPDDGCMHFLHFEYDKVPWAADACKMEFGSMPNLIIMAILFITF